ncbi:serpin family protein [candidate division WOR-3 bacterium]|nr:serpin family protein [candidate division WOR-3 bacterium]
MNTIHRFLVVSLVVTGLMLSYETVALSDVTDADKKTVVDGNNMFALELYTELKEQEGNLFFSPYSISTALAMTYAGARGNTEKQMAEVLHFELSQKCLHPTFHSLISQLNAQGKGYQLNIANALWGQKGYGFLEEFLELTKANYGAGLNEVDFVRDAESARKTINAWVEEQTKDKIKDLIKPGILDALTVLVLTNAIYFKGNWASQFKKKETKDSKFYVRANKTVKVPMMYQKEKFKYMETDGFQAIELPYVDNELSMVILLPKKREGLVELENSLNVDSLNKWLGNLRKQEVTIYLPKFKMTSEFRLEEVLASMGMPDAFSGQADFSGMIGRKELFISAVIHKAFVDVNEEGTEAAAATAVVMAKGTVPVFRFRADHPFIFLIRDISSGSILFLGRVVNPLK